MEHLDSLLKLKEERIEELQKQLERKQVRRKEIEAIQNSLAVPFDSPVISPKIIDNRMNLITKTESLKSIHNNKILKTEESRIPVPKIDSSSCPKIECPSCKTITSKPSITEVAIEDFPEDSNYNVDVIKSDVFKEVEIITVFKILKNLKTANNKL